MGSKQSVGPLPSVLGGGGGDPRVAGHARSRGEIRSRRPPLSGTDAGVVDKRVDEREERKKGGEKKRNSRFPYVRRPLATLPLVLRRQSRGNWLELPGYFFFFISRVSSELRISLSLFFFSSFPRVI